MPSPSLFAVMSFWSAYGLVVFTPIGESPDDGGIDPGVVFDIITPIFLKITLASE
jgi:hypothetical protein